MRPIIKVIPNTPLSEDLETRAILQGTYYHLIPEHKKPDWQSLVLKYERGETLTKSEIEFAKSMNSLTCKIQDKITRREDAKINAKYRRIPYIVGFETRWL